MAYRVPVLLLLGSLLLIGPARAQTLTITTSSDEARTHFDQGRASLLDVDLDDARSHFDAAIVADPEFTLAYVYRAFSAPPIEREERMRTAAAHAAGASEGERALITALQTLLTDDAAGLTAVNATADRFPDDAHLQYMAGVLNYQADQLDTAEAQLERAIAAEPDMGGAHNILGYVRLDQEDYAGSEAALREYIRVNPDHPNPYDSLGEIYLEQGRYDEALEQLEMALQRDPEFAASLNNVARVHIERAGIAYEQAISRGDAAAIALLFTPGGALLPPGTNAIAGRSAITSFWEGGLASGGVSLDLETEEVTARDDMAYERGSYTFSGGGETERGKFVAVWFRGPDGTWRLHRDIWNSNGSAAE